MNLPGALRRQAETCTALGSPFTGQVLALLAARLRPGTALTDRLLGWTGVLGSEGQSVPLRLAGALHGLVLDGAAPGLAALYPPHPAPDDDALWQAIETALHQHQQRIDDWLNRPPQTNEVGRSAVLIAAAHWLTQEYGLPLTLSELGASAGLNLMWDRFALKIGQTRLGPDAPALTLAPDWTGAMPPRATPRVIARRGTDLTPLDPGEPGDALRLLAYLWPDQPDRLARSRAAIAVAGAEVDRADAADWLQTRLEQPHEGLHLIYHTIAWQYFPPAVQTRAAGLIETAGAAATALHPLAWLSMEADETGAPGAGLTLRLWPGNRRVSLGRADFHGRWVTWAPKADTSAAQGETAARTPPGRST